MWRIFKSAHVKVYEFRAGRTRQPDEDFIRECALPSEPGAARIAVGVRRAVGSVGLVDPLFIRGSDRGPEELGVLPLWDSMDWLSLLLAIEVEFGKQPRPMEELRERNSFSVKQLVHAVYEIEARSS